MSAVTPAPIADTLMQLSWDDIAMQLYANTANDVETALSATKLSWQHFLALLSPAAEACLPAMVSKAHALTRQRFGHTVTMFVPLYLANLCANECTYCGFTMSNRIKRTRLSIEEVERECTAIKALGFDAVLLVTGEHETKVGMPYFEAVLPVIRKYFSSVAMEVQPLATHEYQRLRQAGVNTVLVYQETYHPRNYGRYHLRGNKADFAWRLATPERLGQAGMNKIGLGALLGLSDWRVDSAFTGKHLMFLQQSYWQSRFSVAFPRIKPCSGNTTTGSANTMTEKQLLQLICAYRLFQPEVELSLSTRESPHFRDNVIPIAINSVSAGSQTQPGGYSAPSQALEQFSTEDTRPVSEVVRALTQRGLDPVWSDWLPGFG